MQSLPRDTQQEEVDTGLDRSCEKGRGCAQGSKEGDVSVQCHFVCSQGVGLLLPLLKLFCPTPSLICLPIGWSLSLGQGHLRPSRALSLDTVEGGREEGGWSAA